MKTIEQAAREYSISVNGDDYSNDVLPMGPLIGEKSEIDFKKGVEFVTRWISIKDAKPDESGFYLTKINSTNNDKKSDFSICVFCFRKFFTDNPTFCVNEITHWRPIEFE